MARQVAIIVVAAALPLFVGCSQPGEPSGPGRPAWATADRQLGPVDRAETVQLQLHLKLRNADAALAELWAISDPKSPSYGKFLSTEQYDARYAPSDADVAAVRAELESVGLSVTYVPGNHAYVTAEGRAPAVEKLFSTTLAQYQVGSEVRRAATRAITLPPALASRVGAVLGVSTPNEMKPRSVRVGGIHPASDDPDASSPNCSQWYGQLSDTSDPPYAPGWSPLTIGPCGYFPPDVRKAYGFSELVDFGLDGTGVKVAIVDAYMSPTLLNDAQQYAQAHDPTHPLLASQFTAQWAPGTPRKPQTGWYGEQTLDVEAVHGMAPGASIVYVGAQSSNDTDLIAAINMIVEQNLATIVSNSYGSMEEGSDQPTLDAWHAVAVQAGLKGVGLYFSSGDDGDESLNTDSGKPSADMPAALDVATAVGGTSLAVRQDGHRLWEVGWETGLSRLVTRTVDGGVGDAGTVEEWSPAAPGQFVYGSGGGISQFYAQPAYQRFLVPYELATANGQKPMRVVPDVAMLGDPDTGFVVGQTSTRTQQYRESVIGGTSLACPLMAATMALAEENAGHPMGFANPLFYHAYWLFAFRDVAPSWAPKAIGVPGKYALSFDAPIQSIRSAIGYDDVTGLGTPSGIWFLWATSALTPPPVELRAAAR